MSKAVRIECSADGYAGNWVEFPSGCSRADITSWDAANTIAVILEFMRRVVVACHLELTDGASIDTPEGLTEEGTNNLPIVLEGFLVTAFGTYVARQRTLGNLSPRLSSNGNDKATTVAAATPTPT